ncbi:hypothetical protein Tco_0589071 [Tanacetum coccineum]
MNMILHLSSISVVILGLRRRLWRVFQDLQQRFRWQMIDREVMEENLYYLRIEYGATLNRSLCSAPLHNPICGLPALSLSNFLYRAPHLILTPTPQFLFVNLAAAENPDNGRIAHIMIDSTLSPLGADKTIVARHGVALAISIISDRDSLYQIRVLAVNAEPLGTRLDIQYDVRLIDNVTEYIKIHTEKPSKTGKHGATPTKSSNNNPHEKTENKSTVEKAKDSNANAKKRSTLVKTKGFSKLKVKDDNSMALQHNDRVNYVKSRALIDHLSIKATWLWKKAQGKVDFTLGSLRDVAQAVTSRMTAWQSLSVHT